MRGGSCRWAWWRCRRWRRWERRLAGRDFGGTATGHRSTSWSRPRRSSSRLALSSLPPSAEPFVVTYVSFSATSPDYVRAVEIGTNSSCVYILSIFGTKALILTYQCDAHGCKPRLSIIYTHTIHVNMYPLSARRESGFMWFRVHPEITYMDCKVRVL